MSKEDEKFGIVTTAAAVVCGMLATKVLPLLGLEAAWPNIVAAGIGGCLVGHFGANAVVRYLSGIFRPEQAVTASANADRSPAPAKQQTIDLDIAPEQQPRRSPTHWQDQVTATHRSNERTR